MHYDNDNDAFIPGSSYTARKLRALERGLILTSRAPVQALRFVDDDPVLAVSKAVEDAALHFRSAFIASAPTFCTDPNDGQRSLCFDSRRLPPMLPSSPDEARRAQLRIEDMERVLTQLGWPVRWVNGLGNAWGRTSREDQAVLLDTDLLNHSELVRLRVLCHEAGHVLLGDLDRGDEAYLSNQPRREVEAELFSYFICAGFGIDVSDHSTAYTRFYTTFQMVTSPPAYLFLQEAAPTTAELDELVQQLVPDVKLAAKLFLLFMGGVYGRTQAQEAGSLSKAL